MARSMFTNGRTQDLDLIESGSGETPARLMLGTSAGMATYLIGVDIHSRTTSTGQWA